MSKQGNLVSMFHEEEKEMVIQSIHNYFLDFFGNSMEYQWMARHYTYSIPRLRNLSSCFDMTIVDLEWEDDENLENFFAYCPVWKCINIYFPCMYDIFTPESKIHLAESVKIHEHFATPILSHFKGKQLVINHTFCKFSELVEFVNKWKSGESFHKLEYLRIQKNLLEFPQTHFFNEIGAKYIPATRIPPIHTLLKVHVEDDRELNTDPIISHAYVVRETDNRVASVMIQGKTMSFGVWDMTEEEFLSMVDYFQIYFVGRIISS
ncbi:hypothetical protein B9Z55_007349 [Caenorhabditis nigoni]|nr:hypothetical protein B9Z55_007349 [Caenorhabditis nigoni]